MERLTLGHLVPSSESAGNTQADPESARLAGTAGGSMSIVPPSPTTDNVIDTADGTTADFARLIGETGTADASRPRSGPFRPAGGYDIPDGTWRER